MSANVMILMSILLYKRLNTVAVAQNFCIFDLKIFSSSQVPFETLVKPLLGYMVCILLIVSLECFMKMIVLLEYINFFYDIQIQPVKILSHTALVCLL